MEPSRVVTLLAVLAAAHGEDCVWDKESSFPAIAPLIFDSELQLVQAVLAEDGARVVTVAQGTRLILSCPRGVVGGLQVESVEATCVGGTTLSLNPQATEDGNFLDETAALSELGCSRRPRSAVVRGLGACGEGGVGEWLAIGYNITGYNFFTTVRVCFDVELEQTLYTEHVLDGAHIAAKDKSSSRPSFKSSSGYFSVSMRTVYTKSSQLALFQSLLGDEGLAGAVCCGGELYLARGHLAPDGDFVTEAEQDSTYYYQNAIPQWQAFNNGNWKRVEYATRALGERLGKAVRVYTGGQGLLALNDVNNNPADVFLGLVKGKRVVPAPALAWKVVYEEDNGRAAAVVGVNNPHLDQTPAPLCYDLCSSLGWLELGANEVSDGYTYCCTVGDLRKVAPHVPDLGRVALLTVGTKTP